MSDNFSDLTNQPFDLDDIDQDPYDLINLQVDLNSDIDYILFEVGLIVANLKGFSEEEILNSWWFKYYEENHEKIDEAEIVED